MRIGITMRTVDASSYVEPRDALSYDWTRYLLALGHIPILIPSAHDAPVDLFKELGCSALLLTNGEDVAIERKDQNWVGSTRDIAEASLLTHCINSKVPVVGVCRGFQFINVFCGGSQRPSTKNHVAVEHAIQITDPAIISELGVEGISTNSYHQLVVTVEDLATDLKPFAVIDNVIEGFYSTEMNVLAIQWHPERESPNAQANDILMRTAFSGIRSIF